MLAGTEVLWPEGDPYYDLMVLKISDPSSFISEKQNDPIDPTKIIITKDELNIVDFRKPEIQEILNSKRNGYYCAIDPSLGKRQTADNSVIVSICKDSKTGMLYVVDFSIKRRTVDQQIFDLAHKYTIYKYRNIAIETNAFQIVMADNLRKYSRENGLYLPVTDIQNYSDKHMRILSIVPLLRDGTLVFDRRLIRINQQYNLAIEHITTYYEGASDDDVLDALEQCVRICRDLKFKMVVKKNN